MSQGTLNIVYVDCFSGISGDMFLAALIDAGMPLDHLKDQLKKVNLTGYKINAERSTEQCGIQGTRLTVAAPAEHHHRTLKTIDNMIRQSGLQEQVKDRSLSIFAVLAQAEAKIHGCTPAEVHFHEVGAVDSIVDIIGAAIGLEFFKIDRLISSPLPVSSGWVNCQHGILPLPAPAVCELLRDVPVRECSIEKELVTPTGAAILKGSKAEFGPFPSMTIRGIGYGAGSRTRSDGKPNLIRLVLGEQKECEEPQTVEIIEANLDDWSPESFPYLCEKIMESGALDVSLTQILMKKGRPGFRIQAITAPEKSLEVKNTLLSETTSIGLRYRTENRVTLPRQNGTVQTKLGQVQVKKVDGPAGTCLYPEYESCRKIAAEQGVPIKEIYRLAASASTDQFTQISAEGTATQKKGKNTK